jgi:uncharacterized FlaG/YvyC family protein
MADISIALSQIQPRQGEVNLISEFKRAASGPEERQDVAFDGKLQPADTVSKLDPVIDSEAIKKAVAEIAAYAEGLGRSLAISVDDRSGDFVVQVQNAETDELIRQIPSEEVLAISQAISDQLEALEIMGEKGARGLFLEVKT